MKSEKKLFLCESLINSTGYYIIAKSVDDAKSIMEKNIGSKNFNIKLLGTSSAIEGVEENIYDKIPYGKFR